MSLQLLNQLISEAESQLEIDLMDRYEIPFQATDGSPFAKLPSTSLQALRTLAELISVIRVLETDFGRGTSVNSDKYTEKLQARYDKLVAQLMAKRKVGGEETREWQTRPLDGVMVAYNNKADNGFRGQVYNTSESHNDATYGTHQINAPSASLFTGLWDEK